MRNRGLDRDQLSPAVRESTVVAGDDQTSAHMTVSDHTYCLSSNAIRSAKSLHSSIKYTTDLLAYDSPGFSEESVVQE